MQFDKVIDFIRSLYPDETPVPLHAPRFIGREKEYLQECIDSTYVSYVGKFVTSLEEHVMSLTGARYAVAMVNGTSALHMALLAAGVNPGDEVITQDLTFVATAAAIRHVGAEPVFIDVELDTLGMSPESLEHYLQDNAVFRSGRCFNRSTGRRIAAVVPMHTFGLPLRIDRVVEICAKYGIVIVEDAAEAIGSVYKGKHMGRFGKAAVLSFNGNKPVTTGGGGMLFTDDEALAERARFISTTAKVKHQWEFYHTEVGYNLRMPNVNAAIGCAQMEHFDEILENKRETAKRYREFFRSQGIRFISEIEGAKANFWLNGIVLSNRSERDAFLEYSNANGIQTRPVWTLMHKLPPYSTCEKTTTENAEWLEDRVVNIPSSVRL